MKKKSIKKNEFNLTEFIPPKLEDLFNELVALNNEEEAPLEWFNHNTNEILESIVYKNPNEKNSIVIDFNKTLDRKDLTHLEVFNIDRRCFYSNIENIIDTINFVLNMEPELILIYLHVYTEITKKINRDDKNFSNKEFKDIILNFFLKNEKLLLLCSEFIDSTYTISLDSETGRKINTDLQLTDDNNKIILKTAMVMRFLIPLLCLFKQDKNDKAFLYCSNYLIKYYSGNSDKVLNKLFKIVSSRVQSTVVSDRVFWNYGELLSITPAIVTNDIRKSILKQIIPKISPNTSSIKFLDVVIRFKVNCVFTYKYKWSYKPIKTNAQEEIDEREKMEYKAFVQTHNESDIIANEVSIQQEIERILKLYDNDDINNFIEKTTYINSIRQFFLDIYYFNKFQVIGTINQRTILLYHMINDLKNRNFLSIPLILESNLKDQSIPLAINSVIKKKLQPAFKLPSYKKLLTDYSFFLDIISNKNFLATLFSSLSYNYYDDEGNDIEINSDLHLIECIKFIELLG